LPFDSLVPAFSHASDERTATHAYFQSYLMVEFIRSRGGAAQLLKLIDLLGRGVIEPDEAFAMGAQLPPELVENQWNVWVQAVMASAR
jgi:hypothetical protein